MDKWIFHAFFFYKLRQFFIYHHIIIVNLGESFFWTDNHDLSPCQMPLIPNPMEYRLEKINVTIDGFYFIYSQVYVVNCR